MQDLNYDHLNPGIRQTVKWLRDHGFDTRDSGDGQTGQFECDHPLAYVHLRVASKMKLITEADRLKKLLKHHGVSLQPLDEQVTTPSIQADYDPADGSCFIQLFGVNDTLLFGTAAARVASRPKPEVLVFDVPVPVNQVFDLATLLASAGWDTAKRRLSPGTYNFRLIVTEK